MISSYVIEQASSNQNITFYFIQCIEIMQLKTYLYIFCILYSWWLYLILINTRKRKNIFLVNE